MNTQDFKRKLTAVFSADVAGYSRLMGEDEAATVKTLEAYKQVMFSLIKQHRGRVIDSPGDNLLAEFASVVDAVQCGVAVQNELKVRNADLPENRKMQFRIGINLGDVIEEGDRIYGDGVNIAARLESLADPGGICVSKTAFDHIEAKLPLGYHFLGEQTVKNIAKPVGAYKVLMEPRVTGAERRGEPKGVPVWRRNPVLASAVALLVLVIGATVWNFYWHAPKFEAASKEKMAFPLPDKPSVAVLPFDNISGDREQDYLADGITDNIISYLSKHPAMFVIDRKSSLTYKGKHVKVQQVSEDLGVRFILEGSVQKSGNKLRVTAQLVDALKGQPLWSERYDRDFQDLFALQDEITTDIQKAMGLQLTGEHLAILYGTKNLEAWGYMVKEITPANQPNKENILEARSLCEKASKLDPSYGYAWNQLAWTYVTEAWFGGWTLSPAEALRRAMEYAQKEEATGKAHGGYHTLMNVLYLLQGKYDDALAEGQKAIGMEPNAAVHYARMATALRYAGRPAEAIANSKKAMRLNPYYPAWYLYDLGAAYEMGGQYNDALATWKKLLERSLKGEFPPIEVHEYFAITYTRLGQMEKARAHADEILKLNPKYAAESFRKNTPYKDRAYVDGLFSLLIKAGLPEKPPLPLPDKPSIAVLPFVNMSDDPQQDYFSDGMTEDLITDLSKISGLFVIARNSTFVYKGKPVNIQQVSRELGVKYVLEGSVRRAGDQVRINAQLLDATTGQHLWAERYDGSMKDVFSLQDKINQKIVAALAVKLTSGEKAILTQKGTQDPAAYEEFLKGREHYLRFTKEDFAKAEACFKRAIELDPNYSRAKASLALMYFEGTNSRMEAAFNINYDLARLRARQYCVEAMKEPTSIAYQVAGVMDLNLRQWDAAISRLEKALALDPNDPTCHDAMSGVLSMSGRPAEGMEYAKTGMRLDPLNPARYLGRIGIAHFCMGERKEAATAIEKALKLNPEFGSPLAVLASAYARLGLIEEGRAAYETYRRLWTVPISVAGVHYYWPFKDRQVAEYFMEGLLKAGLPGRLFDCIHVSKEDQLTGDDLRAFYFPSTTTGYYTESGNWSLEIAKDGKMTLHGNWVKGGVDTGRAWLEGDKLWYQYQNSLYGMALCGTAFKNPKGTPEGKDEYIRFNDIFVTNFARLR
jgi:adenylate cyclase